MIARLEHPHTPGCNNQLVLLPAEFLSRHGVRQVVYRDAIGRRHKHAWRAWLALICNDLGCDAVVLVRADTIEQLATTALNSQKGAN